MSYTPTTWADGDLITAQKLNNIENGINTLFDNDSHIFNNSIAIQSNDNLNNYLEPGIYYCEDSTISTSLSNSPTLLDNNAFVMLVFSSSDKEKMQLIISKQGMFTRSRIKVPNTAGTITWTRWINHNYLALGTSIKSGDDLNHCTQLGTYYSSVASDSLKNCPTDKSFSMDVRWLNISSLIQIIYPLRSNTIFYRSIGLSGGVESDSWYEFAGIEATKIITQPSNATITASSGASQTFSINATGVNLTYQWQESYSGHNWTDIPNATSNLLFIPASSSNNQHKYRCIITNINGTTLTSKEAILTVV